MSTITVKPPQSAARVARYPFPFTADTYRYSTNIEPAGREITTAAGSWGSVVVDRDGQYVAECSERRDILTADPSRCQELSHMRPASWDAMMYLLRELADTYPDAMSLRREGSRWYWKNSVLDVECDFEFGEDSSLPVDPLRFAGSQVQEDIVLLDQRDGALWADAGLVTFAADWSMKFDLGMSFLEVHGPVPRIHPERIISRAQQFLLRLQPGEAYRRTNWTVTVGPRLDTATETYPVWGPDRRLVLDEDVGSRLHLRTEVQHLIRLPRSGAVMFLIRTYLLSLSDLATVASWRERTANVFEELPDDMADYKGISRFRSAAVHWLRAAA